MELRKESVAKERVKEVSQRLRAEIKAGGTGVMILSREIPDSGLWDVIGIPLPKEKQVPPEFAKQLSALVKEGFRPASASDQSTLHEFRAGIAEAEIEF